jgi:hypothetical protein
LPLFANVQADCCADSNKAGNNTHNETTWKGCDNTGSMGSCCRHISVIFLANIHGTGENHTLPLSIIQRLLETIDSNWAVGVLYDLGCSLDKYMKAVCDFTLVAFHFFFIIAHVLFFSFLL